jgi:ornithine lipid hydroxylase
MEQRFKNFLMWTSWPGLMILCMAIAHYGFTHDLPYICFNLSYVFLMVAVFFLERYMPHEPEWVQGDGQTWINILHTLSSKGTVQALLVFGGVIGLSEILTPVTEPGYGIWPREWPLWAQVCLGLVMAEFGLYWAHRTAHEWMPIWYFHAIHHSVTALWFVNTGRFHFVDSLFKILLGMGILLALGAPMEIIQWLSAITAFIGILTHCNIEMKFGILSWFFNTPELHRWHHSKNLREGDKNYCENIMLWDWVFGTYFREHRRPPKDIGIKDFMPSHFGYQLLWPFITQARREKIAASYLTE